MDSCYTGICLTAMNRRQQVLFDQFQDNGLEPEVIGFNFGNAAVRCTDGLHWLTFTGQSWLSGVRTY